MSADASSDAAAVTTRDALLNERLWLRQPATGHRSGTDAILLAAALGPDASGSLVDLGAGAGAAGLAAAIRCPALNVRLVEIDPTLVALATRNIADNGLADRAQALPCDALAAPSRWRGGLLNESADVVIANPPWLTPGRARASPDAARARAHITANDGFGVQAWLRAMAALTRSGGEMAMIHRADALTEVLDACDGRFGDLAVLPVYPRAGAAAIRIVVRGRKGSRAPLRIAPGLTLHEADGRFTSLAEAIHRGEAGLDWAVA